VTVTNK